MPQKISVTCVPIEYLVLGPIGTNVYIIEDGKGRFIVDPACDADVILQALDGRPVDAIVLTHGHWDHTGAAAELREALGAPVIASENDTPLVMAKEGTPGVSPLNVPCPVDRTVGDGDVLKIGDMEWQVMATPGHTTGSMCYFLDCDDPDRGAPVLVSGDTLFAGTHGRTDFEEGNLQDMRASLVRLAGLPPETIVLPGHNAVTTIALESGWLKLCCL